MSSTVDVKHLHSHWSDFVNHKPENLDFHFLAPKIETYYRSKAFVSQVSINPLVGAAAPLFFLIEKVRLLKKAPDLAKLHDNLVHELNAFQHQAQARGYTSYVVLAVRHVMCLWIDQTILNTPWGENTDEEGISWSTIKLIGNSEAEQNNFFLLLMNRCLQEPKTYGDLLELLYVCLSLGFHGASGVPHNNAQVNEMRNCLFDVISKQHEGFTKRLEIDTSAKVIHKRLPVRLLLRVGTAIALTAILISSYFVLNQQLEAPLKNISNEITA